MKKKSEKQLPLFQEEIFYISQSDAAKHLGITSRMINYWENQDLLHPEFIRHDKKSRKYTPNDLKELRFIKSLLVDQGYTIPSLKEKLEKLEAPYYYEPGELLWDIESGEWRTKKAIALEEIKKINEEIDAALTTHLPETEKRELLLQTLFSILLEKLT